MSFYLRYGGQAAASTASRGRHAECCPHAVAAHLTAAPALEGRNSSRQHHRQQNRLPRRHLMGAGLLVASQLVQSPVAAATAFEDVYIEDAPTSSSEYIVSNDDPPTFVKAPGRIIAIGDLHGDMAKAVASLQIAGVLCLNERNECLWCGGDATVVQLGDVLDRGDDEISIVMLLRSLDQQARPLGGAVYMLNGNHESLNIAGDFRYVTGGAFVESALAAGLSEEEASDIKACYRARLQMYLPGGPMARELSKNPTVLVVNDTAFAHGGLLPIHVKHGLQRLNGEVAAWMRGTPSATGNGGKAAPPFLAMGDSSSVMWNRSLGREHFPTPIDRVHTCNALKQALASVGAERLVVGHTPQMSGCNCECDGRVWRVDVGMSYGVLAAAAQVLEIRKGPDGNSVVQVLTEPAAVPAYENAGLDV